MHRWWHLPLAGLLLMTVSASFAYYLRGLPPVDTFALSFRVTRQQAVLAVVLNAQAAGVMALPVDVQRRPDGVAGVSRWESGPIWIIVVDVRPIDGGQGYMRLGCVVDGSTKEIRSCQGGNLKWMPND